MENQHLFVLVNFFTPRRTISCGILCQLVRQQRNMGWQLRSSNCYFRHLLVPDRMLYVLILIPCLFSLLKSLLKINKYPSKDDSLLQLLGAFPFCSKNSGCSKIRAVQKIRRRRRSEPKHIINFPSIMIVWDTKLLHLQGHCYG